MLSSADQKRLLTEQLRSRCNRDPGHSGRVAGELLATLETGNRSVPAFTWEDSAHLAHAIDGYELCERAGLGDPYVYADVKLAEARDRRCWTGTLLELWVSLFLEHRRWRFAGMEPGENQVRLLDELCLTLRLRFADPI